MRKAAHHQQTSRSQDRFLICSKDEEYWDGVGWTPNVTMAERYKTPKSAQNALKILKLSPRFGARVRKENT